MLLPREVVVNGRAEQLGQFEHLEKVVADGDLRGQDWQR